MAGQRARALGPLLALFALATCAPALAQPTPPPPSSVAPTAARLVVVISEIRSDRGSVRCTLFASSQGWPTDRARALAAAAGTPHGGRTECVFEGIAPGEYAVAVHHDEDGQGDFDTGIFGIPTEGVGASRDAHGTMGPPSFEDARITLRAGENRTRIHMAYP
ncbi:MAG: DUF2141 domain-containing protein [Sandaracinus sp.]